MSESTTSRSVLVSASDAGLCYSVNEGIRRCLNQGLVSGASLLVVAPFAREAVQRLGEDLGIQLALSCEHELLEMRPITHAPSLLGGRGGFPVSAADAAEHADPDEVHREFRAQIEKAMVLGVRPTFLSTHDDVVARELALFDVFLDLAEEYKLPIRHGYDFGSIGLDAAKLARDRGHVVADATINWSTLSRVALLDTVSNLSAGLNEIIVSPAVASDELTAILNDAAERSNTLSALESTPPRVIARENDIDWLDWSHVAVAQK